MACSGHAGPRRSATGSVATCQLAEAAWRWPPDGDASSLLPPAHPAAASVTEVQEAVHRSLRLRGRAYSQWRPPAPDYDTKRATVGSADVAPAADPDR